MAWDIGELLGQRGLFFTQYNALAGERSRADGLPSALPRHRAHANNPRMLKARVSIIPVTPFQQNCTLLWDEESKRGAVIDPGGDLPQVEAAITQSGMTVE